MALFSLKKIGALAQSRQAYLRGISLYNAGKVHALTRVQSDFYAEFITARVQGEDGEEHQTEAGFDNAGEAEWISCTCGHYREGEGACRHIIGMLTDKYYRDMLGTVTTATASAAPTVRTADAAKSLIRSYPARDVAALRAAGNTGDIRLTFQLVLSGLRPMAAFVLERGRQYMIKDIAAFVSAVQSGDSAAYGSTLSFFHHRSAFTADSKAVLDFLLSEATAYEQLSRTTLTGRELPLSPGGLDRLIALAATLPFTVRVGGDARTVTVHRGDPAVSVTVKEQKGGVTFVTSPAIPLIGSAGLYVLTGNTLHCCTAAFAALAQDWLIAAHHEREGLTVEKADLPAFCAQVLPAVREVLPVSGEQLLKDYLPLTPQPQVYLDCPEEGTVTARVSFLYGEREIPLFADVRKDERRDMRLERAVRVLIERYFTGFLPETGEVVFHGDDDAVYDFLTEGLPALEALCTVFATDAFKRLRPALPPEVSVGVQVAGDLLELSIDLSQWDTKELATLLTHFREQKRFTRLRSGAFVPLSDETVEALALLAEELDLTPQELKSGRVTLPRYRALQLQSLLRSRPAVHFRQDAVFGALAGTIRDAAKQPAQVPASLEGVLRPYQKEGFRWLKALDTAGFGGILADDMGLGKTLQIISLLLAYEGELPSLVVCPTSLVLNWENEIKKFAPALTTLAVVGDVAARAALLAQAAQYRVIITSYDLLKRDILLYKDLRFRYHILDEAQYIKNQKTQNARAVKAVVSERRFALTGTPMENRLSELWSIFDFLMPGFLYSYTRFKNRFELPAVREGDTRALKRLSTVVAPFLMRRLKADVLTELPPKTEQVITAHMEEAQRKIYAACTLQVKERIGDELAAGTFESAKLSVLTLLTRLRQICCDPALCVEGFAGASCKREACLELLQQAKAAGHRVLLFSQFTSMLSLLEEDLKKAGITYMVLKGSTPAAERARLVHAFNNGSADVFLISLKAGGTGLNLTGADTVIHYDPWWNLAAEQQATDRAHRIGQTQPVQVIRLVVKDTVEERILKLQEQKKQLADAVLSGGITSLATLSAEELLALL